MYLIFLVDGDIYFDSAQFEDDAMLLYALARMCGLRVRLQYKLNWLV